MILRAAIVFLLVLNLAVAAWWLAAGGAPSPASVRAEVAGAPGLRLAGEAPPPATIAPPTVIAATTSPATQPQTPAIPAAACLRFGPFADLAARDAARAQLQPLAAQVVARDTHAGSARGWRVYLPAQPTREAAQAVVEQIKAAGFNDWYIIANGAEANSIALGRYGSEDSARRRQAQLAAKGFSARAEPLGGSATQWWLDARLQGSPDRTALAAIAPSRPIGCASLP